MSPVETPKWYVVAGGPSSGKTTLWKSIGKLGYYMVPEAAQAIIEEHAAKGITLEELRRDGARFNRLCLERDIQLEEGVPKDKVVFFDRSLVDNIVYHRMLGMPTGHIEAMAKNRYRKVFFMQPLSFYEKGSLRTEDAELAGKLSGLLLKAYRDLDYQVIEVPPVSVEERVSFVLSRLD
jgi:predicted ATPase